MTKGSMTNSAITLLGKASADERGQSEQSGNAQMSWGRVCAVKQCHSVAETGTEISVEPNLLRFFRHFTLNSVCDELGQGNVRAPTTSGSDVGRSAEHRARWGEGLAHGRACPLMISPPLVPDMLCPLT